MSGGCPYVTPACVACTGFCERVREAQRNLTTERIKALEILTRRRSVSRDLLGFSYHLVCFTTVSKPRHFLFSWNFIYASDISPENLYAVLKKYI